MTIRTIDTLPLLAAAPAVACLLLFGCSSAPPVRPTEAAKERAAETAQAPAEPAAKPPEVKPPVPEAPKEAAKPPSFAKLLDPSQLTARAPAEFQVRFTTSKGDFMVGVHRSWAPRGADRFYNLVRNGFFDDARFFRIVPNFIVQFGIHGEPQVARAWYNANFRDDPVTQSNKRGYLVYATAGPNTRTTQLFINLRDNPGLDSQGFAPFGEVTEGMELVDSLYSGYGEAPDQSMITNQGNSYLKARFPNLDYVRSAAVVQ